MVGEIIEPVGSRSTIKTFSDQIKISRILIAMDSTALNRMSSANAITGWLNFFSPMNFVCRFPLQSQGFLISLK